ncbi:DUF3631 domain-containing protein [Microbacterium maritypicum]|uniref:DUF3631 domain-containing protein n=1 Tax=Microbacterium maritypicum TaxID=33918 RepID=UPI001B32A706|nr:DUF3631 domain-containing protein [Microbacterium liquefaciens]MBP5802382.1 DUF3631 domain-containing protein [Microbacterium liquefaciens]
MKAAKRALAAVALGWYVIPCGADKRPLTKSGLKDATNDADTIRAWWGKHPDALPAVVAGRSGLAIADFDVKSGKDGLAKLDELGHPLPATWRQKTPSGGSHAFYAAPAGVAMPNGTADLFEKGSGIDRRTGESYAVLYDAPPRTLDEIAPAPEWLTVFAERPVSVDRSEHADVESFRARLVPGKPSKDVKRAVRAFSSKNMSHADMLEAIAELVKLGQAGHPGVAKAIDAARDTYADGWGGEYRSHFDNALQGSVRRFGLPLETFKLTKADRRRIRDRQAEPTTLPLTEGAAVLDEVRAQIRRFVALPSEWHEAAAALWAAHTHLITCFDSTPRIVFASPEPGSGKTRMLEILEKLAHDPVATMNTTTAFLARRIDSGERPPTILFDEFDTLFGARARDAQAEELRGIFNSGHRRGASYSRAATRGKEVVLEEFNTFAPVAMAGLGDLPDTIRTRAIVVPMRRRTRAEAVEPYRERQNGGELEATRSRLAAWARTATKHIGNPWPMMPDGIADRDADVWEPLLAVADAAGGEWPALARDAALVIVRDAHDRPASLGIRLLADVRRVFDKGDHARLRSTELLHELVGLDEAPWNDLGGKGAIDSRFLGRTFDGYGIPAAHPIRFGAAIGVAKGWDRRDFGDAWTRYLPDFPPEPATLPLTDTKEHTES